MILTDKESIYALQETTNKEGQKVFECPRCKKVFKFNIRAVRYCQKCGQHISPAFTKDADIKRSFLNSLKKEDIEGGNN